MIPATSSQKQKMHMWQKKLNKINLFFDFKDWSKSKINLKIKIKIDPKCNYKKVYFILYLFFITRGSIPYAIEMECMKRVAAWESLPKIKEIKEYRVWRKTERDIAMTCDKIIYFYFLFLFFFFYIPARASGHDKLTTTKSKKYKIIYFSNVLLFS